MRVNDVTTAYYLKEIHRDQSFLHIDAIFQVVECFESEELTTNLGKVELK